MAGAVGSAPMTKWAGRDASTYGAGRDASTRGIGRDASTYGTGRDASTYGARRVLVPSRRGLPRPDREHHDDRAGLTSPAPWGVPCRQIAADAATWSFTFMMDHRRAGASRAIPHSARGTAPTTAGRTDTRAAGRSTQVRRPNSTLIGARPHPADRRSSKTAPSGGRRAGPGRPVARFPGADRLDPRSSGTDLGPADPPDQDRSAREILRRAHRRLDRPDGETAGRQHREDPARPPAGAAGPPAAVGWLDARMLQCASEP